MVIVEVAAAFFDLAFLKRVGQINGGVGGFSLLELSGCSNGGANEEESEGGV